MIRFCLLFLFLILAPRLSVACSCDGEPLGPEDSFMAGEKPRLLPLNSKGFFLRISEVDHSKDVLRPPISSNYFQIFDLTASSTVPYRVKELTSSKLDASDLLHKEYYRLEPVDGFKADHKYRVTAVDGSTKPFIAVISHSRLEPETLSKIMFVPDGKPETTDVWFPAAVSCSAAVSEMVQKVKFVLPDELKPYQESLRMFVSTDASGSREQWRYRSSMCSWPEWGRSISGFGNDLIYKKDASGGFRVFGSWGFFELEDDIMDASSFTFGRKKAWWSW